ncbi:hypothetical protein LTR17_019986 [Elasticomyces elasticus]|nr:hypothetical protein LTR17_019986 [Elasticomyces elasticus]
MAFISAMGTIVSPPICRQMNTTIQRPHMSISPLMTSPCRAVALSSTVSAEALTHALVALDRQPPPDVAPLAGERDAHFRNCFVHVCSNGDVYDAVRGLIADQTYWAKEEAHFEVIFDMVRDYNGDLTGSADIDELACPPLAWFRNIWHTRQKSLQVAMQST